MSCHVEWQEWHSMWMHVPKKKGEMSWEVNYKSYKSLTKCCLSVLALKHLFGMLMKWTCLLLCRPSEGAKCKLTCSRLFYSQPKALKVWGRDELYEVDLEIVTASSSEFWFVDGFSHIFWHTKWNVFPCMSTYEVKSIINMGEHQSCVIR